MKRAVASDAGLVNMVTSIMEPPNPPSYAIHVPIQRYCGDFVTRQKIPCCSLAFAGYADSTISNAFAKIQ